MQLTSAEEKELIDLVGSFRNDPLGFVMFAYEWGKGSLAGFEQPSDWQIEVLDYIGQQLRAKEGQEEQIVRIAVASGHGVGKSALVSWVSDWAISTEVDCKGVITANTENQLKTKTWAEQATWFNRLICKHWFDFNATNICSKEKEKSNTWRLDQITWSLKNTEAFAGMHNQGRRILLIFDEASAIPDEIWRVCEGALTDRETQIIWLCFGNPTRNTGAFRECFGKMAHRWKTFRIDSRTVPISNKKQIEEWANDYGEDSDFFRVRVRGEFPNAGSMQFIATDLVENARGKHLDPSMYSHAAKVLGVDVARFGDDETVFCYRQGLCVYKLKAFRGLDTQQVAELANQEAREFGADAIFVDAVGIGAGVVDRLRALNAHNVFECNGGAKALRHNDFVNKNAEMWNDVREWLKLGGALPPDSELCEQLINREYSYDNASRLQLEKKSDMKARGLSSPDRADALALTFYSKIEKYSPLQMRARKAKQTFSMWG